MTRDHYTQLIIQELSNEISSKDKLDLDNWVTQSQENRDWLIHIQNTWKNAEHYKKQYEPNISKALKEIEKNIHIDGESKKVIPLNPVYKWSAIAAALVVLLAIGWFLNANFNATTTVYTDSQEQVNISLPDGSTVVLNANSSISYKKRFKTRNVNLSGEAYFDVEHNAQKPFKVIANSTETTVLGTTFNVSSYPNQSSIDVSLFTGKIAFKTEYQEEVVLKPGEKISFNAQTSQLTKSTFTNQNIIAWQTGTLTFEQASLTEVVDALEKHYDKKINLILPENESCIFTGKFEDISFDKVIEILAFTYDLSTQENNDQFTLTIKSCN